MDTSPDHRTDLVVEPLLDQPADRRGFIRTCSRTVIALFAAGSVAASCDKDGPVPGIISDG